MYTYVWHICTFLISSNNKILKYYCSLDKNILYLSTVMLSWKCDFLGYFLQSVCRSYTNTIFLFLTSEQLLYNKKVNFKSNVSQCKGLCHSNFRKYFILPTRNFRKYFKFLLQTSHITPLGIKSLDVPAYIIFRTRLPYDQM